jgi:hypothetical protein
MASLPVKFQVEGSDQFDALARRLREAADFGLDRELSNELTRSVQGLPADARRTAEAILPHRGGLNTWLMERTEIAQSTISTGATVTVRTTASSVHAIDRVDSGTVRHPLFGDKRHWYTQSVRPGWWSTAVQRVEPTVRPAVERAVDATARRIEGI